MGTGEKKHSIFTSELEQAQRKLSELLGEETLLEFRSDVRKIFQDIYGADDFSEFQKRQWTSLGRKGLDETKSRYLTLQTGLNLMNISDAFLSLFLAIGMKELFVFLGYQPLPSYGVAFLLSSFLYLLNTGLVFGKALINRIAYPKEEIHPRLPDSELRFRAGWNKGVLQSSTSLIGMVLFGMITSPQSRGYKLGLRFVRAYHVWKQRE